MLCSKCGAESETGKVIKGAFVCKECSTSPRKAQEVTLYALDVHGESRGREPVVVSAVYKVGARYMIRQCCDQGWPYESKFYRFGFGGRPGLEGRVPGHLTPQSAVDEYLHTALSRKKSREEALREGIARLDAAVAWAKKNGFNITQEVQEEPVWNAWPWSVAHSGSVTS